MKLTPTVAGLLALSGSVVLAGPAAAQYGSAAPAPKTPAAAAPAAPAGDEAKQPKVSKDAHKDIVALQTAVNAKDAAAISTALAAAQAKAKSSDDRYVIGKLQLKAAVDANDTAAMQQAISAVISSGFAQPSELLPLYTSLGKLQYNAKAFDQASASLEQALRLDPGNVDAMVVLAESRNSQGRAAEGVTLIQKAIATELAAGRKPEENWYKRAVKLAYDAKLPTTTDVALQWATAFPTASNWREVIRLYQIGSQADDADLIDSMRLARAAGALQGESDYFRYTNALVSKGYAGEAKAVLEEGFASKAIDKSRATFSQLYTLASSRSQGDRASLGASATAAKAAADAKRAMTTADAYLGYGDYAEAAALYRVALTKNGVDKDLANLRLGMALAGAGDKAGATAALNAAGGAQSAVAKLWLTYLATKS